jgi:hypothetical protein
MEMRRQTKTWICQGAAVLLLMGAVVAQERPLPEVAREKSGRAATRELTNEDLEATRPAQPPAAELAAPASKATEHEAQARITIPGLLEQGTLSETRALLESLRRDEEVLLRRYAQIQEKLRSENDLHLRQLYTDSLSRRDDTLAKKRKQIEEVQKAVEAAEREQRSPNEPKTEVKK